MDCRKCYSLGHTGSVCRVKLPTVKFDNTYIDDKTMKANEDSRESEEDETEGDDRLEKYYASQLMI